MRALTSFKRSVLAILLVCALVASMMVHRSQLQDAEHQVVFSVSATIWKVSELIFEAQRFITAISDYAEGPNRIGELQLRFDVLWSRMDVVAGLEFKRKPMIADSLDRLFEWRARWDPILFGELPLSDAQTDEMRRSLSVLVAELRRGWITEFEQANFGTWAQAASTTQVSIARQEWMIAGLLVLIIAYLAAEVFFASVATRRERALRDIADRASKSKSDFIANVSHEIRTPLNGIISMASHLSDHPLTREQQECVAVIEDAGDLLLSTINDVLDLSKLDAGQFHVAAEVFEPMRGLRFARDLYGDMARDKGLELRLELPHGPLPRLEGDERRVRQVLHNLVSNAVKFTEAGQVTIRAWYDTGEGLPGQAAGYYIEVADTGPGIAPDAHERVFEPFAQEAEGLQRGSIGTGLGLPISRALCDAMGGTISLDSAPSDGTCFKVFLPFGRVEGAAQAPRKPAQPVEPRRFDGWTILITDDNATNRFVLRKLLEGTGACIHEASSGIEALECLAEMRVDVVLMDIQMPGLDGMETTARLFEAEALAGRTPPPVIGVTANVMPEQVARYKSIGMVAVLAKPVSKVGLTEAISGCVTEHARENDPGQSTTRRATG
ncbi:ATP-binding protein [Tateyamaria sp. SN6-1]|uniref:ATP-binding protein n=1 Tax=Tateyamaria sp. SN6-1 TaxID=3092148 RepID=UPI0039F5C533